MVHLNCAVVLQGASDQLRLPQFGSELLAMTSARARGQLPRTAWQACMH